MSILIRGMEIPEECNACPLANYNMGTMYCKALTPSPKGFHIIEFEGRREDCPLVEVKEPHGDLVDRDELLAEYDRQHKGPAGGARKIMETAPPVIGPDYGDPIAGIRQKAREAGKILVNAALNAIEETEGSAK